MRLCVKYYYRKNIERMIIDEDCALFRTCALNRPHVVTGLLVEQSSWPISIVVQLTAETK